MNSTVQVGSKVKHSFENGDGVNETEFGVVVHIWQDPETGNDDAYVAFFGDRFPEGKPDSKPCILRYFVTSLEVVE